MINHALVCITLIYYTKNYFMKNGLKDGDVFDIAIVMMARVQ
jgi:hypothetical protein